MYLMILISYPFKMGNVAVQMFHAQTGRQERNNSLNKSDLHVLCQRERKMWFQFDSLNKMKGFCSFLGHGSTSNKRKGLFLTSISIFAIFDCHFLKQSSVSHPFR